MFQNERRSKKLSIQKKLFGSTFRHNDSTLYPSLDEETKKKDPPLEVYSSANKEKRNIFKAVKSMHRKMISLPELNNENFPNSSRDNYQELHNYISNKKDEKSFIKSSTYRNSEKNKKFLNRKQQISNYNNFSKNETRSVSMKSTATAKEIEIENKTLTLKKTKLPLDNLKIYQKENCFFQNTSNDFKTKTFLTYLSKLEEGSSLDKNNMQKSFNKIANPKKRVSLFSRRNSIALKSSLTKAFDKEELTNSNNDDSPKSIPKLAPLNIKKTIFEPKAVEIYKKNLGYQYDLFDFELIVQQLEFYFRNFYELKKNPKKIADILTNQMYGFTLELRNLFVQKNGEFKCNLTREDIRNIIIDNLVVKEILNASPLKSPSKKNLERKAVQMKNSFSSPREILDLLNKGNILFVIQNFIENMKIYLDKKTEENIENKLDKFHNDWDDLKTKQHLFLSKIFIKDKKRFFTMKKDFIDHYQTFFDKKYRMKMDLVTPIEDKEKSLGKFTKINDAFKWESKKQTRLAKSLYRNDDFTSYFPIH